MRSLAAVIGLMILALPVRGDDPPKKNFSNKPTLPAGLPSWFGERDKNGDGQVALYEWPRNEMDEFRKYDRNGDGFLTADEVLRTIGSAGTVSTPPTKPETKPEAKPETKAETKPETKTDAPAFDERTLRQAKDTIGQFDTNKDGKLDKKELERTNSLKNHVDKYDLDKDGMLDENEVAAWWKDGGPYARGPGGGPGPGGSETNADKARRWISELDKDKKGKLNAEQLKTKSVKWDDAKAFDADKDNMLDEKELVAYFDKQPARPGGGPNGGGRFGSPEDTAKRTLEGFDKNKDGKLSKEEFEANRWNRTPFKDVDTNGDGFADNNELVEHYKKMRR